MITDKTASYTPDMAALIDRPDEILADDLGISLEQARRVMEMIQAEKQIGLSIALARAIGWILSGGNPVAKIYGLAFATGLDQLNGLHSQAEAARQLGVTRALLSHYVVSARDALGINVVKFRKNDRSRDTYRRTQISINHPNQRNK